MNAPMENAISGSPDKPGPEEAFRLWREPLCRYALKRSVDCGLPRSPESAEDAVQLAFEAALRVGWETIEHPRAWLYEVTRRVILRSARAWHLTKPWPPEAGRVVWSSVVKLPPTAIASAAAMVTHELHSLPTMRRSVFYLREILGFSYAEIAEELDISVATARVHGHLARVNLRQFVIEPIWDWWSPDFADRRSAPSQVSLWRRIVHRIRRAPVRCAVVLLVLAVIVAGLLL